MKRILIPTDFSDVANNAVQYAISLTKNTDAKYIFFNAGGESEEELRQQINNVAPIVELVKDRVLFASSQSDFKPETIKSASRQYKADLIIIGTHGEKTPLSPKIFGSNTSAIIDGINVPVLAVPSGFVYKGIAKIAFASDFINLGKELDKVIAFAKTFNAALEIVHVSPVFPDIGDTEKINAEEIIEEAKKRNEFFHINYFLEKTAHDNQIAKGIENYINAHSPDLLTVFHISRSWLDKVVIPSTSAREITRIRIPTLIFPKEI